MVCFEGEKKNREGVFFWDVKVKALGDGAARRMAEEFKEETKKERKGSKWIFCARHVETDELEPPDMKAIIEVVDIILKSEKECDNLLGCVIQGKYIDDKVKMAVSLFNSVFGRDARLHVVDSQEEAEKVIQSCLDKFKLGN